MDPPVFATSPGWRISPFDALRLRGLMNSAIACEDPLVLEHVDLYNSNGPAPVDISTTILIGRAQWHGQAGNYGFDYLSMTRCTMSSRKWASMRGIDLRSLDRASLDWETISASVKKTNNVLIVEQGAGDMARCLGERSSADCSIG